MMSLVGSLATDFRTAVGPFRSEPWLGEHPSARASPFFLPSAGARGRGAKYFSLYDCVDLLIGRAHA